MTKRRNKIAYKYLFFKFVPKTGLEPVRPYGTRDFKSLASTNSATSAMVNSIFKHQVEATTGLEPVHNGFADRSLSHLGTSPI